MGIPVPVKYLCWAELVVASLINPKASFLGHLTGIAAGFIHIKVTHGIIGHWESYILQFIVYFLNPLQGG